MDFIEQRIKSDPVARKILAMDETATRELDMQEFFKGASMASIRPTAR